MSESGDYFAYSDVKSENPSDFMNEIKIEDDQDVSIKEEIGFDCSILEVKDENESESSDIELEPEPMVYEVQKKTKRKKCRDLDLLDPLKEDVKIGENEINSDAFDALGSKDPEGEDVAPEKDYSKIEFSRMDVMTNPAEHDLSCCSTIFKNATAVKVHLHRKHKCFSAGYTLKCDFCEGVFKKEINLRKHIKTKHQINACTVKFKYGSLACDHCPLLFSNFNTLKVHLHRKHSVYEKSFLHKCRECDLSYEKIDSLKKHIRRTHHTLKPINETESNFYECKICGMIYETQSSLTRHMGMVHKTETLSDLKYFCHLCGDGFIGKRPLRTHVERTHSKVEYACEACGAQFKLLDSFRKHLNRKHLTKAPSFLCLYCKIPFNSELCLSAHINSEHSLNSKGDSSKKSCDLLEDGYSITTNQLIADDVEGRQKTVERHSKPLECKRCSFKAHHWKTLARHVKRVHLQVRLKKCPQKTTCQFCGLILNRTGLPKHIQLKHTHEENDRRHKS